MACHLEKTWTRLLGLLPLQPRPRLVGVRRKGWGLGSCIQQASPVSMHLLHDGLPTCTCYIITSTTACLHYCACLVFMYLSTHQLTLCLSASEYPTVRKLYKQTSWWITF